MQSNQISINCEMTISIVLIQSSIIRMVMMTNDTETAYYAQESAWVQYVN